MDASFTRNRNANRNRSMSAKLNIAGKEIELVWDISAQRRYELRQSELGGVDLSNLAKPAKALSVLVKLLWCLLPPDTHKKYSDPEELYLAIDEDEAKEVAPALALILAEMFPTAEKKSSLRNTHLPESNSESAQTNGMD